MKDYDKDNDCFTLDTPIKFHQSVFSDTEESEDSFCEDDTIPPKEQAMRKIEFALADIDEQIQRDDKTLILRASYDKSHFALRYSPRNKKKLDRDLHCLHQVYDLLENDKKSTKRELFYEHKLIYEVQRNLDSSIRSVCELLNQNRANLNILSCGRGILRGSITFLVKNVGVIDARVQDVLVTDALLSSDLVTEADFILVVEKDTTYQKLIDESFQKMFPNGILVTSKGYPDIATRNVLKMLHEKRKFRIYGLFDADPHGIEIYLTYKYGASKEPAEGRGAFVPSIQWIGLFPSDSNRFVIDKTQRLPLVHSDYVKIENMIPRSIHLGETTVTRELDFLMQNPIKFELEAINMCGPEYMGRYLIAPRVIPARRIADAVQEKDFEVEPCSLDSQKSTDSESSTEDLEDSYVNSDTERMMDDFIDNDSD